MKKFTSEAEQKKYVIRKTIIGLSSLVVFLAICVLIFKWINNQPNTAQGQKETLRKILNANENVNNFFYSNNNTAPIYSKDDVAKETRVNGFYGLKSKLDTSEYFIKVITPSSNTYDTLLISIDEIKAFKKQDVIYNFKCVEGWSQINWWGGTRLSEFLEKYHLGKKANGSWYNYVGFITPDNQYYVGIDMKSALHPQTILCYELKGQLLPMVQGYPLRLIIPVKYGIKNIKRIGTIFFSDTRPKDYWYERGYDYDAAL